MTALALRASETLQYGKYDENSDARYRIPSSHISHHTDCFQLDGGMSVSYTHLDVYKRQVGGLVRRQVHVVGVLERHELAGQVRRDVDEHGAGTAGLGDVERLAERSRQRCV